MLSGGVLGGGAGGDVTLKMFRLQEEEERACRGEVDSDDDNDYAGRYSGKRASSFSEPNGQVAKRRR